VGLAPEEIVDGRYRVVRRIGSGGMADVWLAADTELDRQVALKVLHENFARDREFVERFRREASSAAGLQHPNVVGVFDRGRYGDTYYIAMEFVDGSSLRDLVAAGMEPHEAVEVTRQVLDGAEFAHERGIVHRDLKPANVLIDRSGRTRVTDFGIARAGESEITQTGSVMGTAQYLSPEQAQGMEVTAAADIYSIGVMLFEMLTGRVPFEGDNTVAIAMKQVSEQPVAPSTINPAVSPSLDAVVLRALAKDPANRFASAAEMRAALDAAEADPVSGFGATERFGAVPPPEEERSRKWLWIALAVLGVLLVGLLIWLLTRGDTVRVPGVINQSQAAATIRLQSAGFEVDVDMVRAPVAEGRVFEQDPPAGSEAERGSTVTISVSMGAPSVAIPDVSGQTPRQARRRLRRAGFDEIRSRREASDEVQAGRVIGTEPAADTELGTDQPITLLVSSGAETATVPSVIGEDRAAATRILEQAGFIVNSDPERSSAPADQVIDQVPGANEELELGEEVTIVYSTGPGPGPGSDPEPDEPDTIALGDYVGERSGFAERQLRRQGLTVRIRTVDTDDPGERDVVLSQNPAGGSDVRAGSRVTLEVGNYVRPEPEPEAP
jgi:eukaryotic-like serine/threonine-protein kinase